MLHLIGRDDANALMAQQVIVDLRSMVKELLDNALDAQASVVRIHTQGAIIESLEVTDNGCGIASEAFEDLGHKCVTSKIQTAEDLSRLESKGFRGEALFSLAHTCRLEITTRGSAEPRGCKMVFWEGKRISIESVSAPIGTTVRVSDLFARLPVRRLDLVKNAKSQLSRAVQLVQAYALIEDRVRITFRNTVKKEEMMVEGMPNESLKARAAAIYGQELQDALLSIEFTLTNAARISGVLVSPTHLQKASRRDMQLFYINGRYVHTPVAFKNALKSAAKTFTNVAPVFALHLQVKPQDLDVNLSPDKMDVRVQGDKELAARFFEELEKVFQAEKSVEPLPVLKRKLDEVTGLPPEKVPKLDLPPLDMEERMAMLANLKRPTSPAPLQSAVRSKPLGDTPLPTSPAPVKHITSVGAQRLNFLQESFRNLQVIGQFNKGFIITLLPPNSLFIVDQHAADEKATFEDLMKHTEIHKQPMVVPQTLHIPMDQQILMLQHSRAIERNGFKFVMEDTERGRVVKLLAKPLSKWTIFDASDFRESIENLQKNDFIADEDRLSMLIRPSKFASMFASRACRKSVMIGTSLETSKMMDVVNRLSTLEKPWNCPHGRPTIRHLYDLPLFPTQDLPPPNFASLAEA